MIPNLENFSDLMSKLEYDIERYVEHNHTYALLDCLMCLNALPEWINKTENTSDQLKVVANEKIRIMKGVDFEFDEHKLGTDIDTKLRFVRLLCNHSKHKTDNGQIPTIKGIGAFNLPVVLPATFIPMLFIGEKQIDADHLIKDVYEFWKRNIASLS